MNKNKILIALIVIIIVIIGIVVVLTLNNKTSKVITPELFEQKAKEQEFIIGEIDNLVTQSKPVTATKMAISSDYKYKIEMYVLENEDATKEFYNERKAIFERERQEGDTAEEKNKNDVDTYTLKSNGNCMYLKRINNILILYNVTNEYEQKAKEFVNSL